MGIEWRDISTAPTKGRIPLWMWRDNGYPMDFPQAVFADTWWTTGFSHGIKPTHWMFRTNGHRPEPPTGHL